MVTPRVQIKLNLPERLKSHLGKMAKKYGITMSEYLRHLILKDIENKDSLDYTPRV